jgi:hypothetical protein
LGDQKDIGEFNLNLLERIEEGLGERKFPKQAAEGVKSADEDFDERFEDFERNGSIRQSTLVDDVSTSIDS